MQSWFKVATFFWLIDARHRPFLEFMFSTRIDHYGLPYLETLILGGMIVGWGAQARGEELETAK